MYVCMYVCTYLRIDETLKMCILQPFVQITERTGTP